MDTSRFSKENEISEIIRKDNNCSSHFQWINSYEYFTLELITFNLLLSCCHILRLKFPQHSPLGLAKNYILKKS